MNSKASVNPTSIKWLAGDEQIVADYFLDLGLRSLKEILDMRVFDLMVNACSVDGAAADGKVTDWWENDVKPWFTLEKWKTIFSSIGEAFGKAVEDFIVFWTVKVPEWWENDVKPWFTLEKWKDLLSSIWKSISTTVSDFSKE